MLPDNPDDQARFFYLALLGAAVLLWVFRSYRGRLGQATQHAAIWVLIFLGVLLAIGFKDNLTSLLYTDQPQMSGDATVVLRRGNDGHFHTTMAINGVDIPFMVDTGATNLVLARDDARRVGIDLDRLNFSIPSSTANGIIQSAGVRLESVRLGDIVDHDVRAIVNGGELDQSLLGMRYLERYRSFEVEGDRMTLRR